MEEEGTDFWGHANDAATMMTPLDPTRTRSSALDYAEANPGTLVLSLADHETGGMTLDFDEDHMPTVFRKFDATYEQMLAAVRGQGRQPRSRR